MKKITIFILSLVGLLTSLSCTMAQENEIEKYDLYVNNYHIQSDNTVIIRNSIMLFPFRTIFESLGATIKWNELSGDIDLEYNGNNYICYVKEPNPGYGKYFYVKDSKMNNHIYLTPMSMGGGFDIVNDYTYLYKETAEYLLRALDCSVTIDKINKIVNVSKN